MKRKLWILAEVLYYVLGMVLIVSFAHVLANIIGESELPKALKFLCALCIGGFTGFQGLALVMYGDELFYRRY